MSAVTVLLCCPLRAAYTSVFGLFGGYYATAFIFTAQLGGGYAKYVWEAVSHEVGHTLGLTHDGNASSAYYTGHGSWAPIMGCAYTKELSQFDKGEFPGSNNQQDDYANITKFLGPVTSIPQSHGSSMASASSLDAVAVLDAAGLTATARAAGIIRQPTDVVFTSFTANSTGNATLRLMGAAPWGGLGRSNLNATLACMDASGALLASAAGLGGVAPFAVRLAAPGRYFVSVKPTGAGSPATNGYSSYGSRGQFELVVTYPVQAAPAAAAPPPPLTQQSSPSPSPQAPASPSPSPQAPASPSPSPSPPPLLPAMTISAITLSTSASGAGANKLVACTAKVTVVDAANKKLGGVQVSGTWTSALPAAGWPAAAAGTTAASGGGAGVASIASSSRLPGAKGNGCTFAVTGASKAGLRYGGAALAAGSGSKSLAW